MDHTEIANLAGVTLGDLDSLLAGRATDRLARSIGVPMSDIEDFIRGSASAAIAAQMGFTIMAAAEELARTVGPSGAIGILIGILISN